jgi:hypothetical protein
MGNKIAVITYEQETHFSDDIIKQYQKLLYNGYKSANKAEELGAVIGENIIKIEKVEIAYITPPPPSANISFSGEDYDLFIKTIESLKVLHVSKKQLTLADYMADY